MQRWIGCSGPNDETLRCGAYFRNYPYTVETKRLLVKLPIQIGIENLPDLQGPTLNWFINLRMSTPKMFGMDAITVTSNYWWREACCQS